MSQTERVVKSNTETLSAELEQLASVLQLLPAETLARIEPAFQVVVDSTLRRRRIMNLVQEALSQLRLDMKYLLFDLEATRRERDELKKRLEDNQ